MLKVSNVHLAIKINPLNVFCIEILSLFFEKVSSKFHISLGSASGECSLLGHFFSLKPVYLDTKSIEVVYSLRYECTIA